MQPFHFIDKEAEARESTLQGLFKVSLSPFFMSCCHFHMKDESFSSYKITGKEPSEIGFLNAGASFDICKRSGHNEK